MPDSDPRPAASQNPQPAASQPQRPASQAPQAPASAQEHPQASPDSPQGFTETAADPAVQGSTELPKTPEDLEKRAGEGIPSVQEGAPAQAERDEIAKSTGGAGEPYVGHGDNQPGGQADPMKGK